MLIKRPKSFYFPVTQAVPDRTGKIAQALLLCELCALRFRYRQCCDRLNARLLCFSQQVVYPWYVRIFFYRPYCVNKGKSRVVKPGLSQVERKVPIRFYPHCIISDQQRGVCVNLGDVICSIPLCVPEAW